MWSFGKTSPEFIGSSSRPMVVAVQPVWEALSEVKANLEEVEGWGIPWEAALILQLVSEEFLETGSVGFSDGWKQV